MNRCKFAKTVSGGVVGVVAARLSKTEETYQYRGFIDVTKHLYIKSTEGLNLRVEVNGEDVTNKCFMADDREGWAEVYIYEDNHHRKHKMIYTHPVRCATERLHGTVRFKV